jgi:hypothetical protein
MPIKGVKLLIRKPPVLNPHAKLVIGPLDHVVGHDRQMALDLSQTPDSLEIWQEPIMNQPNLAAAEPSALLPDPAKWARALTTGVAESLAGTRPPQQLIRLLDFHIYRALVNRCPKRVNPRAIRPVVTSVKVFSGGETSVEACSVVRFGPRSHAFAMQFRVSESKWRCCSLIIG